MSTGMRPSTPYEEALRENRSLKIDIKEKDARIQELEKLVEGLTFQLMQKLAQ